MVKQCYPMGGVMPRSLARRFLLVSSHSFLPEENPPLTATAIGTIVSNNPRAMKLTPTLFSIFADDHNPHPLHFTPYALAPTYDYSSFISINNGVIVLTTIQSPPFSKFSHKDKTTYPSTNVFFLRQITLEIRFRFQKLNTLISNMIWPRHVYHRVGVKKPLSNKSFLILLFNDDEDLKGF